MFRSSFFFTIIVFYFVAKACCDDPEVYMNAVSVTVLRCWAISICTMIFDIIDLNIEQYFALSKITQGKRVIIIFQNYISLVPDISLFCYHHVKTIRYVQPYHKHVLFRKTLGLACMHLKMLMPLKLIGHKQRV